MAALMDRIKPGRNGSSEEYPPKDRVLRDSEKVKIPKGVQDKLKRGREKMKGEADKRNECLAFARGDQHVYQGRKGLVFKPTTIADGKQPWRVRQVHNMLKDVIEREVSAATQRVPSYDVTPSTLDPEDVAASQIAEQVALFGYEKWNVRSVMERVTSYAVIADEGFAFPYFNNQVGDKISDQYATGEVEIRVLGPNEVYWEPGVLYENSRWYAIEQARPLDEVYNEPEYQGGKLNADATASDVLGKGQTKGGNMVLVTEFLERPSLKNPKGRWLTLANGHQILPERGYPLVDPKGKVCDEPVMLRLGYFVDPSSERAEGLVRHLLDAQRTINDCWNKLLEWKNLALVPRMFAPKGMFDDGMVITDEPGAVYEVNPVNGQNAPTFAPTPQAPRELFELIDRNEAFIARVSAQNDIPQNIEAGRAIQALIERDQARRQRFVANLAAFHAKLMERCLYLVQRHYTEPRLLLIHGHFGAARIPDFLGAQLLGQCDVRVSTASIEPRTRESVEQRIMSYAQMGWLSKEEALSAIRNGTADNLLDDYEYDVQRANLLIQKIRQGAEEVLHQSSQLSAAPSTDPTGMGEPVPDWMPREFDNAQVQVRVFTTWMKTPEYDNLSAPQKEMANLIYQGYKQVLNQQQAEQQAAVMAQAQQLGTGNAAKPPGPDNMPSLPTGASEAPQPSQ